ncbi:MAG: hypothetical protein HYY25_04995 [Candidatus Wallbacteria bacterium]|nr:hypothetical protein [Candidatus Wallbacteria bacterium]
MTGHDAERGGRQGRGIGLGLAAGLVLAAAGASAGLFKPYEVYGVPVKVFQLGYFNFDRSIAPWLGAGAICVLLAWLALSTPLGRLAMAAGRSRAGAVAAIAAVLATLVPGRPAGLMSVLALACLAPLGIALCRASFAPGAAKAALWLDVAAGALSRWSWRRFVCAAALTAFGMAALVSVLAFDRMPHIHDSVTYWVGGKLFASGRLAWDLPAELRPYFRFSFILELGERQVPMYPPGAGAFLALGHLAGVPWLAQPALCGGIVWLLCVFCRRVAGDPTARIAAALALLSPFLIVMCGETMSHPASLFTFLLFLVAYARMAGQRRPVGWAFAAGLALGAQVAVRPLTAFGLSLPFAMDMLIRTWRSPRRQAPAALAMGVGLAMVLSGLLALNAHLTGDPLQFAHAAYLKGTYRLGFGPYNLGNDHWPEKGIAQSLCNWNALQKYMFEWPLPALTPLLALVLCTRRLTPWQRLGLASALSLSGVHVLHYFQDLCLGPRYYYEMLGVLLFLSACGLAQLARVLAGSGLEPARARGGIALAVVLCTLTGAVISGPGLIAFFSDRFYGTGPELREAVRRQGLGAESLILVDEPLWLSAISLEPGDLQSGPVFARHLPELRPLLAAYPGRKTWRAVSGPPGGVTLEPFAAGAR